MLDAGQQLGFAMKPPDEGIAFERLGQQLYRNLALQDVLAAAVDDPHATTGNLTLNRDPGNLGQITHSFIPSISSTSFFAAGRSAR